MNKYVKRLIIFSMALMLVATLFPASALAKAKDIKAGFQMVKGPGREQESVFADAEIRVNLFGAASRASETDAATGLVYTVKDGEITITGYTGSSTTLTIPATIDSKPVTAIADFAFSGKNLQSVTIGPNVAAIGKNPFAYCLELNNIYVDAANTHFEAHTMDLYDKGRTKLITFAAGISGSFSIPESVTEIGDYACYYADEMIFSLPDSLKIIGNFAFAHCKSEDMDYVHISKNVEKIGLGAFYAAWNIEEFEVDPDNTHYSALYGVLFDKAKTKLIQYPGEKQDSTYNVPSTVTTLGEACFSHNPYFTRINLPKGLKTIEYEVFYDCMSLKTVAFVSGNSSFTVSSGVLFNKSKSQLIYYPAGRSGKTYTIPGSVKTIRDAAFSNSRLASIKIPTNVTAIGDDAFVFSRSLKSVTVSYKVLTFGTYAFSACNSKFVLSGYKKSVAQKYAIKYGYKFKSVGTTPKYEIKAAANNKSYGTVSGAGKIYYGDNCTLTAKPKAGCYFKKWSTGSKNYTYTFMVKKKSSIKAEFAKIGTPTLTAAVSAGYDSVRLTWTKVTGAAGYYITRAGLASPINVPDGNTLTYTDGSLTCGTPYTYQVQAYSKAGSIVTTGAKSSAKSATPVPDAPQNVQAAMNSAGTGIDISWNAVAGADKYEIYRTVDGATAVKLPDQAAGATSYTDSDGLVDGKTYTYTILAFNGTFYSAASTPVSVVFVSR